ncbi:MAG: SAM-dependent methyltransferase [Chloroflexota bacterium]|nr:SAM-dependent methyltransferase [Chloroflexota bacterium]MDE2945621.1 SAM-dependent methyltransferase [Chloroflexota bacterium]
MSDFENVGGSFRDPSGFTFVRDGAVYRQVNDVYREHYDHLMQSGLYAELTERRLLVPHSEVDASSHRIPGAYKVLLPRQAPFISYPYEWCFSQIKDAALATLEILKRALKYGMILKDASAYNIQFLAGKPTLIDTLSFEIYKEGAAWVAYNQFCQHFLAPLALMSHKDVRLGQLLRVHLDGIPLDLAASLLPKHTYRKLGITMHLHLHARARSRYAGQPVAKDGKSGKRLGKKAIIDIADSLRATVQGLRWDHRRSSWAGYYAGDSYQDAGFDDKRKLVSEYLDVATPKRVWDLGANTGVFSRIASERGAYTVSMDNDPGVVEENYLKMKERKEQDLLPLLIDLSNPSAAAGWANEERDSLGERRNADCILALALIHHIAIANNVPLRRIAHFFAQLAPWLIIEFVPKHDKKVRALLIARQDIFEEYSQETFERIFGETYEVAKREKLRDSDRLLYLMRRRLISKGGNT